MRLSLTGRQVDISPSLRQLVSRRLARVERLLNDSLVSTQVVLTLEKRQHRAEVIVHARGDHMLTAVANGESWPQAIGAAIEKIQQQAHRMKDKWLTRKRRATGTSRTAGEQATPAAEPASTRPKGTVRGAAVEPISSEATVLLSRVIRMTRYAVKPMRVEDAVLRIQEVREPFVIFRHADTERLAVLFERPDGRLGLIDPEL